jgi:hypothetical protein
MHLLQCSTSVLLLLLLLLLITTVYQLLLLHCYTATACITAAYCRLLLVHIQR